MTVAVNIEDIIGVGITELPSRLYCYPVPVTGFQCFLQKTYQLRCRKGLEDIAGSFHFVTFDCKIRRHGQKNDGRRVGKRSKFHCRFHTVNSVHKNIQEQKIHSQISFFHIRCQRFS